jgi:O-antigen/teichoic acid export membrane protein
MGVSANFIGKASVALVQLLSLALLPRLWGADGFGLWLMISTIPTYLAFSSLGFGDAAATYMTHSLATSERLSALQAFQTVWSFVTSITVIAAVVGILGVAVCWDQGVLQSDVALSAGLLVVFALIIVQTSLLQAGYRATGRYAHGTLALGAMVLVEGLAVVAVAACGGGLVEAASAMLALRAAGALASHAYLNRREPWLRPGWSHFSPTLLKDLRRPALAAVGLTAGDALALQGIIVALGIAASPAAAAAFGAVRTLCRMPLQASDMIGRASTPELTIAAASRDQRLFDRLTALNVGSALIIALPLLVVIALFGPDIGRAMTGGVIEFNYVLFSVIALISLLQALRISISHSLIAVNEQHRFTHPYLALAIFVVFCPFILPDNIVIIGTAAILAAMELLVLSVAVRGVFHIRSVYGFGNTTTTPRVSEERRQ